MITHFHADRIKALVTGFLFVLAVSVLSELSFSFLSILLALTIIIAAFFLAKGTARHFHGNHTHTGDSIYDNVAIGVLLVANVFHPAIDGFSFYETLHMEGIAAGTIVGVGVLVHEIFRQSALALVFKNMGLKPVIVLATACVGIAFGICLGFYGNEILETHEKIIDMATLFAYTFILSEFYISAKGEKLNKGRFWFVALGIVVGLFITLTMH